MRLLETGTALEINSQPDRMDLNDELATLAREEPIKLVINTDSHKTDDFHFIKLGVSIAKRAWCTPADVLNTQSWEDIQKFFSKKKFQI